MKRVKFTYEEGGAINSCTLFPNIEGLARGLWQTEIIRQCFANEP